jgi:hypothetical protein
MDRAAVEERYRLIRLLGAGGEAAVWLAEPLNGGEPVALKYFNSGPGLQELAHALALKHPNLVRVLDYCYLPDGGAYLVYEFAAGGSLREWLEPRGACPPAEALAIARDILRGLDHLHGRGLVHGDIKPENILRHTRESEPCVHLVADFGSAKAIDARRSGRELAGSAAYMAPELFTDTFSAASDLYSVGVLLYEMIAGRRPFEGDIAALARAHLGTPPPPLPAGTPPAIAAFTALLLEKDPRRRLESAARGVRAIDLLLDPDTPCTMPLPAAAPVPIATLAPPAPARGLSPLARSRFPFSIRRAWIGDGPAPLAVLDLGSHLELHEVGRGYQHRMIPRLGPVEALSDSLLVTSAGGTVLRWFPSRGETSIVVSGQPRVLALSLSPDGQTLALATDRHIVFRALRSGEERTFPAPAAGVGSQLAWVDAQRLAVTAGALRPSIYLYTFDGPSDAIIELPGALFEGPSHGRALIWVTAARESDRRFVAVSMDSRGQWREWALPADTCSVTHAPCGVLLQSMRGRLDWLTRDGVSRPLGELSGPTAGMCVSLNQRLLAVWHVSEGATEIETFQLHER